MKKLVIAILASLILFSVIAYGGETRTRIAVVDTGIDQELLSEYLCADGHKDFTGTNLRDNIGHGTAMAMLIAKHIDPETHCLVNLKFYDPHYNATIDLVSPIVHISTSDIKFVNVSAGGGMPDLDMYEAIKVGLDRGIVYAVAAGNDSIILDFVCPIWPACFRFDSPNFHVVGALDKQGTTAFFSNYGEAVTDWAPGLNLEIPGFDVLISGTSPATAIVTGRLITNDYVDIIN